MRQHFKPAFLFYGQRYWLSGCINYNYKESLIVFLYMQNFKKYFRSTSFSTWWQVRGAAAAYGRQWRVVQFSFGHWSGKTLPKKIHIYLYDCVKHCRIENSSHVAVVVSKFKYFFTFFNTSAIYFKFSDFFAYSGVSFLTEYSQPLKACANNRLPATDC